MSPNTSSSDCSCLWPFLWRSLLNGPGLNTGNSKELCCSWIPTQWMKLRLSLPYSFNNQWESLHVGEPCPTHPNLPTAGGKRPNPQRLTVHDVLRRSRRQLVKFKRRRSEMEHGSRPNSYTVHSPCSSVSSDSERTRSPSRGEESSSGSLKAQLPITGRAMEGMSLAERNSGASNSQSVLSRKLSMVNHTPCGRIDSSLMNKKLYSLGDIVYWIESE